VEKEIKEFHELNKEYFDPVEPLRRRRGQRKSRSDPGDTGGSGIWDRKKVSENIARTAARFTASMPVYAAAACAATVIMSAAAGLIELPGIENRIYKYDTAISAEADGSKQEGIAGPSEEKPPEITEAVPAAEEKNIEDAAADTAKESSADTAAEAIAETAAESQAETKPSETKPSETKPAETLPAETLAPEIQPESIPETQPQSIAESQGGDAEEEEAFGEEDEDEQEPVGESTEVLKVESTADGYLITVGATFKMYKRTPEYAYFDGPSGEQELDNSSLKLSSNGRMTVKGVYYCNPGVQRGKIECVVCYADADGEESYVSSTPVDIYKYINASDQADPTTGQDTEEDIPFVAPSNNNVVITPGGEYYYIDPETGERVNISINTN